MNLPVLFACLQQLPSECLEQSLHPFCSSPFRLSIITSSLYGPAFLHFTFMPHMQAYNPPDKHSNCQITYQVTFRSFRGFRRLFPRFRGFRRVPHTSGTSETPFTLSEVSYLAIAYRQSLQTYLRP